MTLKNHLHISTYQISMIRIVAVSDGHVTHIMNVAVELEVRWQNTGFHHVSKDIYALKIRKIFCVTASIPSFASANSFQNAIAESLDVIEIEFEIVDFAIEVGEHHSRGTCRPRAPGHCGIQFWKITLRQGFTQIE